MCLINTIIENGQKTKRQTDKMKKKTTDKKKKEKKTKEK